MFTEANIIRIMCDPDRVEFASPGHIFSINIHTHRVCNCFQVIRARIARTCLLSTIQCTAICALTLSKKPMVSTIHGCLTQMGY